MAKKQTGRAKASWRSGRPGFVGWGKHYQERRFEEALEFQRAGAEPGFVMAETHYCIGLCHLAAGERRLCIQEFESLVAKICWAVPMRLREYLAWRRSRPEPEAGT